MAEQSSALDRMETPPFWLPMTLLRSIQIHSHVIIFLAYGRPHCQLTQVFAISGTDSGSRRHIPNEHWC